MKNRKKVALKILSASKIYAPIKIEELHEKKLVPNMMARRRLTRNAKIMLYLADECGFREGGIVYGSCYGEIGETARILESILNDSMLSPTAFQNSVHNTAPSYFSLVNKNKSEIITMSSGMQTSLVALKTAALQSLSLKQKIMCVAVESINIKNVQEVNNCCEYLEAGAGIVVEIDSDINDAKDIEEFSMPGIMDSLIDLMSVVNMYENGIDKILVEL